MFQHYLLPVEAALYAFPALAVVIVLPAAFVSYRRRGRAGGWAGLVFYTFVFYALAAFLQTVIPLPTDRAATCDRATYASHPNLHPFHFTDDIARNGSAALWPVLLNLALLFPLGFYLRYLWRRGLPSSTIIAFGVSLFFELTQLTGLWFVYPCPYRQFNVDDLMCNTAGAILGWLAAGPLRRARHVHAAGDRPCHRPARLAVRVHAGRRRAGAGRGRGRRRNARRDRGGRRARLVLARAVGDGWVDAREARSTAAHHGRLRWAPWPR